METWAHVWGGPVARGVLRAEPEDFAVEEELGFEPGGGGEHVFLWIRKREANTAEVADALARFAGVARGAVGWSGRKDRRAVTGQWFSVQMPGTADPDWSEFSDARWSVQHSVRHSRKLRIGTHRANRFRLRVRELKGDLKALDARLDHVGNMGFPNYFGEQRFGESGQNLRRAREQLVRRQRKPQPMLLSAARSWLFNRVLDARIADGTWCVPQPGDALMLAGSRSLFQCQGDEPDLEARIGTFDVDVTGPLWGVGAQPVGEAVAEREARWLEDEPALRAGIERQGAAAQRRRFRAVASDLEWSLQGNDLELSFTLPAGVFATSLLREILSVESAA
ncbi:MAG: tRNA pseudouridine(13) synthase TruD [Halofilum sp. (in: g-proteobacteria)]